MARVRRPDPTLNLTELREKVAACKENGRKIVADLARLQSHYVKMLDYYDQWEAEMEIIQKAIDAKAAELGVSLEVVEEFDAVADLLGEDA